MRYLFGFVFVLAFGVIPLVGCGETGEPGGSAGMGGDGGRAGGATSEVLVEEYTEHVETLSSDAFEGRLMDTPGGQKTVDYLLEHFERAGLEPGFGNSYLQHVPLIRTRVAEPTTMTVSGGVENLSFTYVDDVVMWTTATDATIDIKNAEIVFVGYGIVAPEYAWDDYGDVDVAGKVVFALGGEPPSNDDAFFLGADPTPYGRFRYKNVEAARRGAVGAISASVDEAGDWDWILSYKGLTEAYYALGESDEPRPLIEAELKKDAAAAIFEAAGMSYSQAKLDATEPAFVATPMGVGVSVAWTNAAASFTSPNVIGLVRGDTRPDEAIVLTAHWDHLGTDSNAEGDGIYNGAHDNAIGTAGIIEVAEAIAAIDPPPQRSIVVIATTAEEKGLFGAKHYVANPLFPMRDTVAELNIDGLAFIGPTDDVRVVGMGSSELTGLLEAAAVAQDRFLLAAGASLPYRGDMLPFADAGVPYLWFWGWSYHVEHGQQWGQARILELYHYHDVADEYDQQWDLSGAVRDIELYIEIATQLANSNDFPAWSPDSEFQRP